MPKGKLRKLYTNEEIETALDETDNLKDAAEILSDLRGVTITPQLLRYWERTIREFTKANGEPYAGTTVADRTIRNEEVELRKPSPADYEGESTGVDNSCILVIPDLHAPYHHQDALDFLVAVAAKYQPTRLINLGD